MTKADRIRKMLHLSNAEIVRRTGYLDAYIRAVRQRTSSSGKPTTSQAELNYTPTRLARLRARYHSDPEYRRRKIDNFHRWYSANRERHNARCLEYYHRKRAEASA